MEDQVFPSYNHKIPSSPAEKRSGKKIFLLTLIIIIFISAVMSAYFLGKSSQNNEAPMLTNAPTPTTYNLQPTTLITEVLTPTVNLTLTPGKKPSPVITPTPIIKSKVLSSTASLDGFRSSNSGGNTTLDIRSGRNSNLVSRGFVTFDIIDIPSGSTITQATLRLYQAKVVGSPYTAGGSLKVDHLTYGDSLDGADYGMAALSSGFSVLSSNPVIEWKETDVTSRVKDDLSNARGTSQFRTHFQTEITGGDLTGDFVYFESEDNSEGTGNTPQLIVKYY